MRFFMSVFSRRSEEYEEEIITLLQRGSEGERSGKKRRKEGRKGVKRSKESP